ncbi:MAG TPA: winged helix-turn-helix transcriptional regulator, partial [Thermoplasmata archaeon]|nr:winged helix-turn-helix transcriptional regulator [Thermoplasmata archaeon]
WWSDYGGVDLCSGPLQNVCPDPDEIGDTPYVLDADSRDQYPLMARVPTVWSNTPPSVSGIAPGGTEDWTGGSVHAILWDATDGQDPPGNLTVNMSYSGDGGATWTVVASGLAGSGAPYAWRVPTVTAASARVRVCVRDSQNATTCADGGDFAIDATPPTVVRAGAPGDAAPRDAPFQIVFSEPMNRDSVVAAFSLAPTPEGVSFRWSTEAGGDVLVVDHAPLVSNTQYTIGVGPAARDRSDPGNPLATPWSLPFRTGPASGGGSIASPSAGLGAFLALFAVLVLVAGALAIGTERGRVSLLTPFVLAVSRRREEGEEEPETRGMIRGYLVANPGDTFTDIMRNLRLSSGTATWHLRKLELAGVVRSRADGTRRRYYPADVPLPQENGRELPEIEQRLIQRVAKDPGLSIRLIAEELGISSQLALYHLRKLREKGLLCLERRGWRMSAYPSEGFPPP